MAGNDEVSSSEIASTLSSLGETTTAAELVRKQGQSKKLKVISEKKLMEWILSLLKQHMAGKADAFSDAEKEELLRKTQDELKKRMLREQAAEAERSRIQSEYEAAVQVLNNAKSSQADHEKAIDALRAKLENAENSVEDLQQDNYDLQDQLQEKMALLSTTIAEKEKLRDTVRQQMVHSGDLIGGVLGLDNQYYGGHHQEQNPVSEEASQDEQFYHDFNTGAQVIQTLMTDLERLRAIAQQSLAEKEALSQDPRQNLLAADLEMLEQLKAGSLQALDVAQPVASLVEALDGARAEAESMEDAVAEVTGNTSQKAAFTSLPDPEGKPTDVLAGAAVVARELAAEIARSRQRVIALKQIADEAEQERAEGETKLEELSAANGRLLAALAAKADEDSVAVPSAIKDVDASPARRADAAIEVIAQLKAGVKESSQAMVDQLALVDRLSGGDAAAKPAAGDKKGLTERLRKAGGDLEQLVLSQRRELELATARERTLAEHIQAFAAQSKTPPNPELSRSSDRLKAVLSSSERNASLEAASAALSVVEALQKQTAQAAAEHQHEVAALKEQLIEAAKAHGELAQAQEQAKAQVLAHKALAAQLVKAAKGDEQLADHCADLALAADQDHETLAKAIPDAVAALAARKAELAREHGSLSAQVERLKADAEGAVATAREAVAREHALAKAVVGIGAKDPDLADSTSDLTVALESAKPGEPIPVDLNTHVAEALETLSGRKKALAEKNRALAQELAQARAEINEAAERASGFEKERDEMALSGKEIIGQLRQQKDVREKELGEMREENERAAAKLGEFQERMNAAEQANRRLAESLSAIAGLEAKQNFADAPSIEDPRMDLEVALSQLPSEEATEEVVTPSDISSQIAESGHKLAEALSARRQASAAALAKAQSEQERLLGQIERLSAEVAQSRTTLDEREATLKRNSNEIAALRREMTTQGAALAARVQELSQARSENAAAQADLETAKGHESRAVELRTKLQDAQRASEAHAARLAEANERASGAEKGRAQLAQALGQLAAVVGANNPNDPLAKAGQKLEMAVHGSSGEIGPAGEALVEAAKAHALHLSQAVDGARTQLAQSGTELARLRDELANQRGALVDREHALEEAKTELAEAAKGRGALQASMREKEELATAAASRSAELSERLRQAEAELEEYRAREGASAGSLGDEVTQLREELARENLLRKELEAKLHEHHERSEAGDARLKRHREEFAKRMEERDRLIQEKDRLLDEHAAKKVDHKGLEAQVAALTAQLASANERLKDFEAVHGAHAGATTKSGDLARELKKAHGERDQLRERMRQLESELADALSTHEELQTQVEEKRKEVTGSREELGRELGEERAKTAALKEEFRKLKEEVVGLRARLRRLTDDKR